MAKFNGNKAAISLTFDDGLRCQAEHAVPELDARGLSGTFFLCGKNVDRDIELWREVAKKHEIGSHSYSHFKANKMTPEEVVEDAVKAKLVLEGQLKTTVDSFAWPYAISTKESCLALSKIHKQARGGHGSPGPMFIRGLAWNQFNTWSFNTCAENIAKIPPLVETALILGAWFSLMFHGIGPDEKQFDNIYRKDFARLLNQLVLKQSEGLWIAPYGTVAEDLRK